MAISSSFIPSSFSIPLRPTFLSSCVQNRRGRRDMVVRMGGGPRTFPGGVSKWQWKRMQAKKAKQLLKARLLRERQIYEMRKRAELKEAVSQLERPWEAVEKAPNLFSVSVDEQVKTLADRFQKPGGFDMWTERDGPQVFNTPNEGLPSVRFFPKGAVHSIKPYTKEGEENVQNENKDELRFDDWIARGAGGIRKTRSRRRKETVDVERTQGARENASENSVSNRINGREKIGYESTQGVCENASKNLALEKGDNLNRNNNRFGNGSNRRNNTIDVARTQGVRVNVSKNFYAKDVKDDKRGARIGWNLRKNQMKGFKPVQRESEGNFVRNGRSISNGDRRLREVRNTLRVRPTSNLHYEEKDD